MELRDVEALLELADDGHYFDGPEYEEAGAWLAEYRADFARAAAADPETYPAAFVRMAGGLHEEYARELEYAAVNRPQP